MTIYDILFIVMALGVGLIAGLVLINRNAFERRSQWKITISDTPELQARRKEWAQRPLSSYHDKSSLYKNYQIDSVSIREIQFDENGQPSGMTDLEAALGDDSLSDTDAPLLPPSDAELAAIEYLSREDDWL